MKHEDYLAWIDDFIFDRIEYIDDLKEFIEHSRNCPKCFEELKFQYSIRRSLGDVQFKLGSDDDIIDPDMELKTIFSYYDKYIENNDKKKRVITTILSIISLGVLLLITLIIIKALNIL